MSRLRPLFRALLGVKRESEAISRECCCHRQFSSAAPNPLPSGSDEFQLLSYIFSGTVNRRPVSSSRGYSSHVSNGGTTNQGPSSAFPKGTTSSRNVVTSQKTVEAYRMKMEEKKLLTAEERRDFAAVFPTLVHDITNDPELSDMPETNRWLARVLQYNVPHGKQNRGLAVVLAYRYLTNDISLENVHLSYVLGWCVEIFQAFLLVADDIMDGSETRRGQPCWYRVENLGTAAFNDAILLECSIYPVLKKYFKDKNFYEELLELFHETTLMTSYGQSLDTRTGLKKDIDTYTPDLYSVIVKFKTSYYSFYLPVALAMTMAGINDQQALDEAKEILLEMGHFFQVQDDYLDVYGDPNVTGKVGTDIQDGKCSWVIVTALQAADATERAILKENYGKNEPERIEVCKKLFNKLEIPELYQTYEEQTYNLINSRIDNISTGLSKKLFRDMLNKIYQRSS